MRVLVATEFEGIEIRSIAGFPGYGIGADGSVWSRRSRGGLRRTWRRLSPCVDGRGYAGLTLCKMDGERVKARVHRLVAESFILNPDSLPCVRHLDGNPANNAAANLAWGTYAQNEDDKRRHGTYELRRNGKLTRADRDSIRKRYAEGWPMRDLATVYGVSRPTISRMIAGATWQPDLIDQLRRTAA